MNGKIKENYERVNVVIWTNREKKSEKKQNKKKIKQHKNTEKEEREAHLRSNLMPFHPVKESPVSA